MQEDPMGNRRIVLAAVAAVCVVVLTTAGFLAGCGRGSGGNTSSGGAATGGPGPVPSVNGDLVVTGETTLDLISAGRRTIIARAPTVSTYFEYPTFSPDGKMIAYVLATTPTGQGQDWGNDIYTANLDGSNAKLVFKHDRPGALVDSLSWTPDGASIVFAYSRAIYDAQNHYTGSIYRVDRLTIATGATATLINNAMQPSVSWDGKQIVYVDFPQNDFQASSLAIADGDGGQQRKILTDQKGFQGFFAPHLSPDGKKLVFAAVGGPLGLPTSPTPSVGGRAPMSGGALIAADGGLGFLRPPSAMADGSPYQIWIANLDGSGLRTISNLREDLPFPVWAADGQSILFLGAGGLYTAGSDGTNLKRIGGGVPHGEIAWYQHP
jgi:Tol biopolymer transport system component